MFLPHPWAQSQRRSDVNVRQRPYRLPRLQTPRCLVGIWCHLQRHRNQRHRYL